jgi:hypothetical protein
MAQLFTEGCDSCKYSAELKITLQSVFVNDLNLSHYDRNGKINRFFFVRLQFDFAFWLINLVAFRQI